MWNPSDYEDDRQDRSHEIYMEMAYEKFLASLGKYEDCCQRTRDFIREVGMSVSIGKFDIEQAKKYLAEEAKAQGIYFIEKHALFSQIDHVEYVTAKDKQRDEDVAQLHTSNQIGVKALEASEGKSLSKLYQPSFYDFGMAEEASAEPETHTEDTTATPPAPKQDDPTQK